MSEISKTADEALAVLIELADAGPLTPTELARRLGLNRTVVHRLLSTLHRRGFVVRQERGYVPGAILLRMAERVQPVLRAAAERVMAALRDEMGETVILSVADGDDAVVVHECVAASHVLRVDHKIGTRSPLVLGCGGLALLAYMSPARIDRAARTSASPDRLRRRLESIRALGHAESHDELKWGVHGVSVPVFDHEEGHAMASLAVIAPASRAASLLDRIDALSKAAKEVSAALQIGGALTDGAGISSRLALDVPRLQGEALGSDRGV